MGRMQWKVKAAIQRCAGVLPDALSYPGYYALQRTFGGLRHPNPLIQLAGGIAIVERILAQQRTVRSGRFLEIGPGRQVSLSIALWLCGAGPIVSVDLNPYLKPVLVFEHIEYMRAHASEIEAMFAHVSDPVVFAERFRRLANAPRDLAALLSMLQLTYLAPADAARLPLPAASIDYQISFTVLEHIPGGQLERILAEGLRVLAADGLLVHFVDFSDHFAQSDPRIPLVNFLRFSEEQWARWAGNRYAYHNRLRVDEFLAVLHRAGAEIRALEPAVDARSLDALRDGLPLDARFAGKPHDTNATINAWVTASPLTHTFASTLRPTRDP